LDGPTSGQIVLDGQDITQLREDEMAQLRGGNWGLSFSLIT